MSVLLMHCCFLAFWDCALVHFCFYYLKSVSVVAASPLAHHIEGVCFDSATVLFT